MGLWPDQYGHFYCESCDNFHGLEDKCVPCEICEFVHGADQKCIVKEKDGQAKPNLES